MTDPDRPRPSARDDTPRLLAHLLTRAGIDEGEFWGYARNRRSRVLRAGYARPCRDVPALELSAFDIDKLLKERFRSEPLTLGAAWHHGYFRSYFSHAAITHPANDGLREEFSTAWDIVRKRPAVVFRGEAGNGDGERLAELRSVRLDLPMIVGPLPYAAGVGLELAYLRAIAAADPGADLRTRSLVVIGADRAVRHASELLPWADALLVRLAPRHAQLLAQVQDDELASLLRAARIVELDPWSDGEGGGGELAELAAAALAVNPDLLLSVYLRYETAGADGRAGVGEATRATSAAAAAGATEATTAGGECATDETVAASPFWNHLLEAAGNAGVALLHYHAGPLKSYRLTPRVDAFLKERLLRARVQLVSAGGDGDTQASAATVYESVLLGANGGAMTHAAAHPARPRDRRRARGSRRRRAVRRAARVCRACHRRAGARGCRARRALPPGALHPELLAAQHPRLSLLHGHRRHPEDLGQRHGDHHDGRLGARGRRPGDPRVRGAERRPEPRARGRRAGAARDRARATACRHCCANARRGCPCRPPRGCSPRAGRATTSTTRAAR